MNDKKGSNNMNTPYKTSESKTIVTVADVLPGYAPSIRVVYRTVGANKAVRPILRQIPVPDAALFARVQAELREGDSIEITAINEWYDDGYSTRLTGFGKAATVDADNAEGNVRNGTINIVQNDITQIILPPVRESRTKVRR